MHITAAIDSLYHLRNALQHLTTELTVISRIQYLGMVDQSILLQEVVRRWYSFLLMVQSTAVSPYLKACAEMELENFMQLAQRIEVIAADNNVTEHNDTT